MTLTINASGTAFTADSLNSINPKYHGDQGQSSSSNTTGSQHQQSQSSSSDSSTQNQPDNSLGKAICNTAWGQAGSIARAHFGSLLGPVGTVVRVCLVVVWDQIFAIKPTIIIL